MKRVVLTFGFIAGAILSVTMFVTLGLMHGGSLDHGMVIGYTTMVVAFLFVFFGIRSYRDNVGAGELSFGKAFQVGLLITLIASTCYVATWEFINYRIAPDFGDKYAAAVIDKVKASGASEAEIAKKKEEMAQFKEMYKNPFFNMGMTFLEVFPPGLLITLVSAGILRRRRDDIIAQPA